MCNIRPNYKWCYEILKKNKEAPRSRPSALLEEYMKTGKIEPLKKGNKIEEKL